MSLCISDITVHEVDDNDRPVIYFSQKDETILQNLYNRHDRPVDDWKLLIPDVLAQAGLPADTSVYWDKHAGCRSCPCSPGFVMSLKNGKEVNVWVTLGTDPDGKDIDDGA